MRKPLGMPISLWHTFLMGADKVIQNRKLFPCHFSSNIICFTSKTQKAKGPYNRILNAADSHHENMSV